MKTTRLESVALRPPLAPDLNSGFGIDRWRQIDMMPFEQLDRTSVAKTYIDGLWPTSESYVSPMNPIFLFDLLKRYEPLSEKRIWMLRDGVLPLIWFFQKFPEPDMFYAGFKDSLAVHADCERFVPQAWRQIVQVYEMVRLDGDRAVNLSSNPSKEQKVDELLILGTMMPSYCSIERLKRDLAHIESFVGGPKALAKVRVRAFTIARFEPDAKHNSAAFHGQFITTLCRALGTNIEFMELEALRWFYPRENTWFHEFNEGWLITDSYLSKLALSKRMSPIPAGRAVQAGRETIKPAFERIYPLYPHIGCGLRTQFSEPAIDYVAGDWVRDSQERAKSYFEAMESNANSNLPWPRWFETWAKEAVLAKAVSPAEML